MVDIDYPAHILCLLYPSVPSVHSRGHQGFVWSLFLSLSASWLPSSLALSLASLWVWMFCTACRSEAHPACFVSCRSPFFDVSFPDVSYYFLRGAGRCFFGPANSGLHLHSLTLNSNIVSVCCSCLSVAWFHSVSVCLSLFFMEMCLASSSLVYSIWLPPLFPSSLLASIRYRLIAGAELYIQVNSWAGWPLPNAYVLCLYRIHSLLLHSECWHGYTLWVLQSLLGWTLKLWPSSVYCSHWHFAELGWQYTYSACQHKKKKKRSMKQNHILASSSLLHVHPTCLILKDLFSCIFHYCQCYGLR